MGGGIAGRTLDPAGRLLSGVRLLLARRAPPGESLHARSAPDGSFHFHSLAPAEYLLIATRAGYLAAVTRVGRLPMSGIDLVLEPDAADREDRMSWVLRLPERDLLRALRRGLLPAAAPTPVSGARLSATVEQRFGLALSGPGGASFGTGSGPLVDTRFAAQGGAPGATRWQSHVDFRDARLVAADASEASRVSEDLGVDGHAEFLLGGTARLMTDARFGSRRLDVGGDAARNRGIDLRARSVLGEGGTTRLSLHVRSQSVHHPGDLGTLERRETGLSVARDFDLGNSHRLSASLAWRDFATSAPRDWVLLDPARQATGPTRVAPQGEWLRLGMRDDLRIHPRLGIGYGLDVEHRNRLDGRTTLLAPAVDLSWLAADRTRIFAAARWLDARRSVSPEDGPSMAGNLSLRLAIFQEFTPRLHVSFQASRENLAARDPLASGAAGGTGWSGIWTDGAARSDEVRFTVQSLAAPLVARLDTRYGEVEGRIATPDPFARTVALLATDRAHYYGAEAAILFPASRTEVSIAFNRVTADRFAGYRVVGVGLRQGVTMPFDPPGTWRLLLDFEQVDGGRPFLLASTETGYASSPRRVGRVSGGVAVQF